MLKLVAENQIPRKKLSKKAKERKENERGRKKKEERRGKQKTRMKYITHS